MQKSIYITLIFSIVVLTSTAQVITSDTIYKTLLLDSVMVKADKNDPDISRLEPIQGTYIFAGKKSEVIQLTSKDVALTEKYGRQVFSKIPGVFVYDMDGTGNQVNIATRGLDPHRGWEFNIRKDGVITNTDMYGYPASHYNIPMEAVERIELVRGTGSLQYGAQFGGMLNYISKQPKLKKAFFESINTVGSFGLVSTYNALSGTLNKKFRYSAWFNKKWNTGYRDNGDSEYNAEGLSLYYDVSEKLRLKFEWTHSNYVVHLAGPLTDSMFYADPQSSTRSRNYYNPDIHVPSITLDWHIKPSTKLRLTTSAVLGARNSVMFDKPATIADTIVVETMQYANRQVDIDHYNSYTAELRVIHTYTLLKKISTLAAGIQYMNNDLHRRQMGKGTTGVDYDLTLAEPGWGRDLHFKTSNIAVFAENRFQLFKGFSLNAGARVESGKSDMTGTITYYPSNEIPTTIEHKFPLFGVSAEYELNKNMSFYSGWSQAYRPVIFKDIIPASIYEVVDEDLEDAQGYNFEVGFRGQWNFLKWDATAFHLRYNNRLGTIAETDGNNNLIIHRSNIGDSKTTGVELFVQADFTCREKYHFSVFTSSSFMDARYDDATVRVGNENVSVNGNKVESTPEYISRNGLTFRYSKLSVTALYSYTSESFADALNTVKPNPSGSAGLVPSYHLVDLNISMALTKNVSIQLNCNNIFDEQYFTKRPQFYPGPGIWPSDGRTLSATVAVRI